MQPVNRKLKSIAADAADKYASDRDEPLPETREEIPDRWVKLERDLLEEHFGQRAPDVVVERYLNFLLGNFRAKNDINGGEG